MELKKLSIEDWSQSVKSNRRCDILSLFTLCALTSRHAMVHLRNNNLWTTVNAPDSYDHDKLLSICDVYLAYVGSGQFVELKRKTDSVAVTSILHNTVRIPIGSINTAGSANKNSQNTSSSQTLQTIGTIKSDPDTLDALLAQSSQSTRVSTSCDTIETNLIKPSSVKLRRLSKTAIKLWTTLKPSTDCRVPLNTTQTFIPIKPRKVSSTSVLNRTEKQSLKQLSGKVPSGRSKSLCKSTHCTTSSPKLSSRITRAQKIRVGMKSPVLKSLMHGLKTYKHRYSFTLVTGDLPQSEIGTVIISYFTSFI